jgi:predicted nucleic acid-binding protein
MILADTGFFYALVDRDDAWHRRCVAALDRLDEGLVTTWPVLTETVHLVARTVGVEPAAALLDEVAAGEIRVWNLPDDVLPRVPVLLRRYAELPMDLADASLVLLAESLGHGRILTTDQRDFRGYRWKSRQPFENLLARGS